jgi:hypothetical protein
MLALKLKPSVIKNVLANSAATNYQYDDNLRMKGISLDLVEA